jgi:hypothetical protein
MVDKREKRRTADYGKGGKGGKGNSEGKSEGNSRKGLSDLP